MVTLDSINLKIAKLQKQASAMAEKQTSVGLAKIRDLMHKHGLSLVDIERFVGKKRGRKPGVKSANGALKTTRASAPVAPKYADPKTGATWTGRGRAPAWIRDVKDRSKFLIAGAVESKAAAAKKAPAKRAAAKKTVATKKAAGRRAAAPAGVTRARKTVAAKKRGAPRKTAAKAPAAAAPAAAAE
ncbi:DNA-binding protein H-NS [Paraburkholderia tropica]|uniref:H-NS histone family protein n=1 Tax=Paraburkholderia TaxID=1822464 RepID=UPI001CB0A9F3|nr:MULTISPECIES: H-NS histone family protein [Paraburkholderia]CAG9220670.1 DNA-binding protein H-NS [Paraburkholderia tropica]